jgi:3-phenylpropionate/trans-cinnamate dioxygenase ferredoxin subunit
MEKKYQWTKVAGSSQEIRFGENQLASLEVGGKQICIVRTSKGLKACALKCPHAGGDLSLGYLDGKGHMVCPVHGYRFCLDSGRDTGGEGYYLKTYPLKESEDGVIIGME